MDDKQALATADEELLNSLSGICASLGASGNPFEQVPGVQLSQTDTLFINNRWYLISNLRQLLSQLYVEHGIIQTLVDQPVDDAYRAGFEIKTSNLDAPQREDLMIYARRSGAIHAVMQARKWARLYGGGGVLIITDQDPRLPLDIDAIGPDSPLEFRPIDMWELYFTYQNTIGTLDVGGQIGEAMGEFYDYYGQKVHRSRVYRIIGKECPSFLRPRLRGWGMSELERIVRSLNSYMKNQDVIFALLDEAKVDVYQMKGFNTALLNQAGTSAVQQRIQLANMIKGITSALLLDKEDEYTQKQIAFTGLAEVLLQLRQGIAADLKMPMTKLFGVSAAGFSSGEDDIENYNGMLEGEIRYKDEFTVVDVLQLCCQKKFGTTVPDLMIVWNSLRILNAKEEEEVKDSQFNRIMSAYQSALIDSEESKESINKDSLLGIELDPKKAAGMPLEGDFTVKDAAKGNGGKQAKTEA